MTGLAKCAACAVPLVYGAHTFEQDGKQYHCACLLLKPDLARASRLLTHEEYTDLLGVVDRATLQPSECKHDDWEWPMQRCPACGVDDARKAAP